jgi:hypothetical protein
MNYSIAEEAPPFFGRFNIAGRTGFVTLDDEKNTVIQLAVDSPSTKAKNFTVAVRLLLKDGKAENPTTVLPKASEAPPSIGSATSTTSYFVYSCKKIDPKQRIALVVGIDDQFQVFPFAYR